jgi:diguanylate cyclase (GGDEF)-like protein
MRLLDKNDTSLAIALVASAVVIFRKPLHLLMDATRVVEDRWDIDIIPGLIVLAGALAFQQYRKRQLARTAETAATADASRERQRSAELERLVAFGGALAGASDGKGIRQVFWRYMPAFARDREIWLIAKTPEGWEAVCDATAARSGRNPDALERSAIYALAAADKADARTNGALIDGDACFAMLTAEGPLGVVGVRNVPQLTDADRRAIGAAVALMASAVRNIQLLERTRENSVRDPLTQCFNRAYALETLATELQRAKRSGHPLSVMMFDVDKFKRLNDEHGHLAGDAVLAAVAEQLNRTLRAGDVKCRWGGDEFLIVLPDTPLSGATHAGGSVTREIGQLRVETSAGVLTPTISLGVAVAEANESDPMALIGRADEALYKAKHGGRNRFVVAGQIRAVS